MKLSGHFFPPFVREHFIPPYEVSGGRSRQGKTRKNIRPTRPTGLLE